MNMEEQMKQYETFLQAQEELLTSALAAIKAQKAMLAIGKSYLPPLNGACWPSNLIGKFV